MSKNVIILLVTLGRFPPELQAEEEECFRISAQEEGDSGVLAAAKPQARHSEAGREDALVLSIIVSPGATWSGGKADGERPDGIRGLSTKMSPKRRRRVIRNDHPGSQEPEDEL